VNLAILTSNHNRHKYFVNEILKIYDVVSEEKSFSPLNYADGKNDEDIINNHFYLRDEQELKDFDDEFNSSLNILKVDKIGAEKYSQLAKADIICVKKSNKYELQRFDAVDLYPRNKVC